jgi:hypothetical protein
MDKMEKIEFNKAYNILKGIVGESGAFILFMNVDKTEEVNFHTHGPIVRVQGLLDLGMHYTAENLLDKMDKTLKRLPREPD